MTNKRETWSFVERWIVSHGLQRELAGTVAHEDLANQIDAREAGLLKAARKIIELHHDGTISNGRAERELEEALLALESNSTGEGA